MTFTVKVATPLKLERFWLHLEDSVGMEDDWEGGIGGSLEVEVWVGEAARAGAAWGGGGEGGGDEEG